MAGFMAADKSYFYTKTRHFWAKRYQFSPQFACSFPPKACRLHCKIIIKIYLSENKEVTILT